MVILDKHFNLGGLEKAAGGSKSKADANVKDSKDTGKHAFNFDEQSRRAAEVIRAAGWVPPVSHLSRSLTSFIVKAP